MGSSMWLCLQMTLLSLAAYTPSEACTCPRPHLQNAFCKSDVVIKATFVENSSEGDPWTRYGLKIHQVFKGGEEAQNMDAVYSKTRSSCVYKHHSKHFNSEYLIAAREEDGHVVVGSCSFIKPFNELSAGQIAGLQGSYQAGCSCTIIPCFFGPCGSTSSGSQCFWNEYLTEVTNQEEQQTCAPDDGTSCTWQSL